MEEKKMDCENCFHCDACKSVDESGRAGDSYWRFLDCEHFLKKEDTVVLTAEEYDNFYDKVEATVLSNIADGGTSCHWCTEQHKKQAAKEVIEKINEKLCTFLLGHRSQAFIDGYTEAIAEVLGRLDEIAKEFGVEV